MYKKEKEAEERLRAFMRQALPEAEIVGGGQDYDTYYCVDLRALLPGHSASTIWLKTEYETNKKVCTPDLIRLAPSVQGQGIGRRLLAEIFQTSSDIGYSRVEVKTIEAGSYFHARLGIYPSSGYLKADFHGSPVQQNIAELARWLPVETMAEAHELVATMPERQDSFYRFSLLDHKQDVQEMIRSPHFQSLISDEPLRQATTVQRRLVSTVRSLPQSITPQLGHLIMCGTNWAGYADLEDGGQRSLLEANFDLVPETLVSPPQPDRNGGAVFKTLLPLETAPV